MFTDLKRIALHVSLCNKATFVLLSLITVSRFAITERTFCAMGKGWRKSAPMGCERSQERNEMVTKSKVANRKGEKLKGEEKKTTSRVVQFFPGTRKGSPSLSFLLPSITEATENSSRHD